MKKIIALVVFLVLISLGIFAYFNIKEDINKTNNAIDLIKENYEELTINVNTYNDTRSSLNDKLSNFFISTYKSEQEEYNLILDNYNNVIELIDNNISNISSNCNTLYKDLEINKICSTYQVLYEKLINLYVKDLNIYNNKVAEYNNEKKESIPNKNMIHNEYIDYNNDNVYEGITNEEE